MLFCKNCFEAFNTSNKRPMVGSCGHSVCVQCIATLNQCPSCHQNSFTIPSVNFEMLDFIENNPQDQESSNEDKLDIMENRTEMLLNTVKDDFDKKLDQLARNFHQKLDNLATRLDRTYIEDIIQQLNDQREEIEHLKETIKSMKAQDEAKAKEANSEFYKVLQQNAFDSSDEEQRPFVLRRLRKDRRTERNCYQCREELECEDLREDGVSVRCDGCLKANIIAVLHSDYKWMMMECQNSKATTHTTHFFPMYAVVKQGEQKVCMICGKYGIIEDAEQCVAFG